MTQDDIRRMAREAATEDGSVNRDDGKDVVLYAAKTTRFLERFATLVAAKEREACEELWEQLRIKDDHVRDVIEASVAAEREACAKVAEETVCDTHLPTGVKIYGYKSAVAIRARGETK